MDIVQVGIRMNSGSQGIWAHPPFLQRSSPQGDLDTTGGAISSRPGLYNMNLREPRATWQQDLQVKPHMNITHIHIGTSPPIQPKEASTHLAPNEMCARPLVQWQHCQGWKINIHDGHCSGWHQDEQWVARDMGPSTVFATV